MNSAGGRPLQSVREPKFHPLGIRYSSDSTTDYEPLSRSTRSSCCWLQGELYFLSLSLSSILHLIASLAGLDSRSTLHLQGRHSRSHQQVAAPLYIATSVLPLTFLHPYRRSPPNSHPLQPLHPLRFRSRFYLPFHTTTSTPLPYRNRRAHPIRFRNRLLPPQERRSRQDQRGRRLQLALHRGNGARR
jgi:hypothetical protein